MLRLSQRLGKVVQQLETVLVSLKQRKVRPFHLFQVDLAFKESIGFATPKISHLNLTILKLATTFFQELSCEYVPLSLDDSELLKSLDGQGAVEASERLDIVESLKVLQSFAW